MIKPLTLDHFLRMLQTPQIRKEAFRVRREAEKKVSGNPAVFIRQLVKDVRSLLDASGDEIVLNGNVWGRMHHSAGDSSRSAVQKKHEETGADSVCEVCLGGAYFVGGLGLDQETLQMDYLMQLVHGMKGFKGILSKEKRREEGFTRTVQRLEDIEQIACCVDDLRTGLIYGFLESHLEFCWSRKKQGGVFWVLPAHPDNKEKPIKPIPLEAAKGVPFFESRKNLLPIGLSRLEMVADFLDENLRRRKIRNRAELSEYLGRYTDWQIAFSEDWRGWGA